MKFGWPALRIFSLSLVRNRAVSLPFDRGRGETARSPPGNGIGVVLSRLRSRSSADGLFELSLSLSLSAYGFAEAMRKIVSV